MLHTARRRSGVALAGWLLGVAACHPLAWWGLATHLEASAQHTERRLADGWHWSFDRPDDLVGRTPVDLAAAVEDGAVVGTTRAHAGYLSLAFAGARLDARLQQRLVLDIEVDRPTRFLLFHRSSLDGPIIETSPIPLAAGRQTVRLDLAALPWIARRHAPGMPPGAAEISTWGGPARVVASLRLHPSVDLGVGFAVHDLRITGEADTASGPWPASPLPGLRGNGTSEVRVAAFAARPEAVLVARDVAHGVRPAQRWRPADSWPPLWPWLPALLAAAALGGVLLGVPGDAPGRMPALDCSTRRRRRWCAAAMAMASLGAAAMLVAPSAAVAWQWAGASVFLVALAALATALGPPREFRWLGPGHGWWIILLLPLVVVPVVLLTGAFPAPDALATRLATYLPWALAQQALLQLLIVRGLGGHRDDLAIAVGAVLFAWLHFPNFSLMLLTGVLALVTALHYRRFHALLPLALAHALAGTVALAGLPESWLRSGLVGMRYFGAG